MESISNEGPLEHSINGLLMLPQSWTAWIRMGNTVPLFANYTTCDMQPTEPLPPHKSGTIP